MSIRTRIFAVISALAALAVLALVAGANYVD
jgi:hypothetical protein